MFKIGTSLPLMKTTLSISGLIGNSLKSDVLPVLNIGGTAVHVPFHTTWAHERIDHEIVHDNFYSVEKTSEIINLLNL